MAPMYRVFAKRTEVDRVYIDVDALDAEEATREAYDLYERGAALIHSMDALDEGLEVILCELAPVTTVTVTLAIENTYALYPTEWTFPTVTIPAPPEVDTAEYETWKYEHIHSHTGVGHEDGEAWYDVEVTATSDPDLLPVGTKFDFGY